MVPKRGLEPPPSCLDMNLNHARLPIPPLRLSLIRRLLIINSSKIISRGKEATSPLPRFSLKIIYPGRFLYSVIKLALYFLYESVVYSGAFSASFPALISELTDMWSLRMK